MLDTTGVQETRPRAEAVDIRVLRYPTEPHRLALAVVAIGCAVVLVVAIMVAVDAGAVIYGTLGLVIGLAMLWAILQFYRIRRLGDAVLVNSETFPGVQGVVDEIRARLQYRDRVDIFVVPNLSPRIQLESYFGVRALLIEGGAIADLADSNGRPQLLFLLGSYFGMFKASTIDGRSPKPCSTTQASGNSSRLSYRPGCGPPSTRATASPMRVRTICRPVLRRSTGYSSGASSARTWTLPGSLFRQPASRGHGCSGSWGCSCRCLTRPIASSIWCCSHTGWILGRRRRSVPD
jgi:hypothetical protein